MFDKYLSGCIDADNATFKHKNHKKICRTKNCFYKNRYIYEPSCLLGCYFSWNFYHI